MNFGYKGLPGFAFGTAALFYSPVDSPMHQTCIRVMHVWCIGAINRWIKQRSLLLYVWCKQQRKQQRNGLKDFLTSGNYIRLSKVKKHGAPGEVHHPTLRRFFSHNKHNRCIYSRKQGNMNWFFRYWRIFMQYINLQISTTQLKIKVIEYVTNRRSTHLQLNFVRLGETVRFTKP